MNLALFDIDGTVTDHEQQFDGLYVGIVRAALDNPPIDTDWGAYPNATDSGITDALFREHKGRAPTVEELAAIRRSYRAMILDAQGVGGVIAGIASAWQALEDAGWKVAFATGNWDPIGRAKMQRADLTTEHWPLAGADCGMERGTILETGVRRAEAHYATTAERVVYLGDASWDLITTRALAMPFVAVGKRYATLRSAGATHGLADYEDRDAFFRAMHEASAPT